MGVTFDPSDGTVLKQTSFMKDIETSAGKHVQVKLASEGGRLPPRLRLSG